MGWLKNLFRQGNQSSVADNKLERAGEQMRDASDLRDAVTWEILDIDVSDVSKYPNTLDDIYQGKIDGLFVRNVVGNAMLGNIEDYLGSISLEKDGVILEEAPFGYVVGKTITGCAKDALLTEYFPETPKVSEIASHIFNKRIEDIVEPVLTHLASGRRAELPKYINGLPYKPCTFRVLKPGRAEGIRVHIGNEFLKLLPQQEHIASLVDNSVQLSYFIVVQEPEEDGALMIFDKVWKHTPFDLVEDRGMEKRPEERERRFEDVKSVPIKPKKGDMFLFDGGRIWHKVSPVKGNVSRITIGGFAGYANDGKHIYYYA